MSDNRRCFRKLDQEKKSHRYFWLCFFKCKSWFFKSQSTSNSMTHRRIKNYQKNEIHDTNIFMNY
ncbi:hypothetical protein DERF_006301 [Dermatophagoides farinae]|uniref:Uncharacterized protein n=1 Tax=Dermatophagoides farinae TaxID=6954 RepID=A0A922I5W4_DERFA|nr:hypothetical protein DERF_006301 [Dermatophagoides farinae]